MQKKTPSEKKIQLATIISGALLFLVAYIIVVAFLIYGLNLDNALTQKTANIVPYPIANWGGKNFITINRLKNQLGSVVTFYENQDFSDLGMRVDFTTEDGKKRLKLKEKNILNKLIENQLIENEAKKRGIVINSEDISQEVSRKMQEYDSEEYFKENMTRLYGWTREDFERNIVKPDMYKEKLFEDIQKKDQSRVDAKNKITAAWKELENGREFALIAEKYSEGESAKNKGELGWFGKSEMLPEIAQAIFNLKKGERSEIIESSLGYHIVFVEDTKNESGSDRLQLKQIFVRTKNFSNWLEEHMKKTTVHIFSRDYYWNKENGWVDFRNEEMKNFEADLEKNSPDDISVLF
jgi:hypothetical protein